MMVIEGLCCRLTVGASDLKVARVGVVEPQQWLKTDVTEGRGVGTTTAPLYWICSDADLMVNHQKPLCF